MPSRTLRAARPAAVALVWMLGLGCTPSTATEEGPAMPPPQRQSPTSGSSIEELFPLVDGHVYQYVTETDQGPADELVIRVSRREPLRGTLLLPGGNKQFEYATDGVKLSTTGKLGVYVLKQPLELGQQWRGEHGGMVEIVEVGATVAVPAGTYEGCVKTVERRGGDRPLQVATSFCPGTGIVLLEAASGAQLERVALKSYGAPVDLGPDGVRTLPSDSPSQ